MAFRLSGSYTLPYSINLAGSLISNDGYPYQTIYSISRAFAATQGVALTRATQVVPFSDRGEERFDTVTMMNIRLRVHSTSAAGRSRRRWTSST